MLRVFADHLNSIAEADSFDPLDANTHGIVRTDSDDSQTPQPIRPREFRSLMVVPFVTLLIGLAIALGILLLKSQPHGKYLTRFIYHDLS